MDHSCTTNYKYINRLKDLEILNEPKFINFTCCKLRVCKALQLEDGSFIRAQTHVKNQ